MKSCFFLFLFLFFSIPEQSVYGASTMDTARPVQNSTAAGAATQNATAAPPQPAPTGNALSAARTIGIVGENVIKARRGWVNLEPGAKPAYVGIQGGTAPITLLRSPKGSLLGYTGNTGNDFIHILQGKEPPSLSLPPSDSKESLEVSLPPPPAMEDTPAESNAPPPPSNSTMQPFGLSTPDHVVLQEESKPDPAPSPKKPAKKKKRKPAAKPKPLKPESLP